MRQAHHVDTFDELLDVARTFNDDCLPPLEDAEVTSAAQSAWKYTESGRNYFGQHAAWFPREEVNQLVSQCKTADQLDLLGLLLFLRANQGPDATFMFTNSLAEKFARGFTGPPVRSAGTFKLRVTESSRRATLQQILGAAQRMTVTINGEQLYDWPPLHVGDARIGHSVLDMAYWRHQTKARPPRKTHRSRVARAGRG